MYLLLLFSKALHDARWQLGQQHKQHQVAPGCGVVASQEQAQGDVLHMPSTRPAVSSL